MLYNINKGIRDVVNNSVLDDPSLFTTHCDYHTELPGILVSAFNLIH